MGLSSGLDSLVRGNLVRCSATPRQYWNLLAKMGIMEGHWNWCTHRIMISLGSSFVEYVREHVWGGVFVVVWIEVSDYVGV